MAFFSQKTWIAGLINLKFFMKTEEASCNKTSQNNFFISPAIHCENAIWNMQIFSVIFSSPNIFDRLFSDWCSTRPLISFTSFLQPAWIETIVNPPSAVGCVQLVPKYTSKVKLDRGQSPNILSEIIEIHKNGAWGKHFPKFPYFHFSTGLNP